MSLRAKTREDIRADVLRTIQNAATRRDLGTVNVAVGSDFYRVADGLAQEIEALYADGVTTADRLMPDTATGEDQERWLRIVFDGEGRRPSGPASGDVEYEATAATTIDEGEQLLGPNGAIYQVATTGIYDDGDLIPVVSADSGVSTNLDAAEVLRWVNPPAFASSQVSVVGNGLTGGVDEEDEPTATTRLLERMGDPPNSANWSSFVGWAEEGSSAVQRAFCYTACNGPSTVHVACAGYASSSTLKSRELSTTALALARANVEANVDVGVEVVVTTVEDVEADVAFYVEIPASVNAIPAGTGGGWVDGVPFPQPHTAPLVCTVTAYTSTTSFTIGNCLLNPGVGATCSIAYLRRTGSGAFRLYTATATVASVTGVGPYAVAVTLDKPFVGIATGDYVWPQAENAQAYVDAVLTAFANLGPGEKTDVIGLLPHAYRKPRYFESWDYRLGANFLSALTDIDGVLDASWAYQNGGTTSPALPASIADAPKIFIPRKVALYPTV